MNEVRSRLWVVAMEVVDLLPTKRRTPGDGAALPRVSGAGQEKPANGGHPVDRAANPHDSEASHARPTSGRFHGGETNTPCSSEADPQPSTR